MNVTLLSGVVRNRKTMGVKVADPSARSRTMSIEGKPIDDDNSWLGYFANLFRCISIPVILRNFKLRVHKFQFKWDLFSYMAICFFSLCPFFFTGDRFFGLLPISVWFVYNLLFLMDRNTAQQVFPSFAQIESSFRWTVEEFFSPKVMPVLSVSFILVVLSLMVAGHKLDGPPLCFSSCHVCLSRWNAAIPIPPVHDSTSSSLSSSASSILLGIDEEAAHELEKIASKAMACGYLNGRELLAYYTMAQTSFVLFSMVLITLTVCLAWAVAPEEWTDRASAEQWLNKEDSSAHKLRVEINKRHGAPGSYIRPEGNFQWVLFGVASAFVFTFLGCGNWRAMPVSPTTTFLVILNVLTIQSSTLLLHLAFFGRLIAIYTRNKSRVEMLSELLKTGGIGNVDAWWNCRNFVLNEDLALDYDIGGLAVSATFIIDVSVCCVFISQTWDEGFTAILESPGNYCAFAVLYVTMCLLKIFTLATSTFEEQFHHINTLQKMSFKLASSPTSTGNALNQLTLGNVPTEIQHINQSANTYLEMGAADDDEDDNFYDFEVGLTMDSPLPSMPQAGGRSFFGSDSCGKESSLDGSSGSGSGSGGQSSERLSLAEKGGDCGLGDDEGDGDEHTHLIDGDGVSGGGSGTGDKDDRIFHSSSSSSSSTSGASSPKQHSPKVLWDKMGSVVSSLLPSSSSSSSLSSTHTSRTLHSKSDSLLSSPGGGAIADHLPVAIVRGENDHVYVHEANDKDKKRIGPILEDSQSPNLSLDTVPLKRSNSLNIESRRQSLADMISQITKYDPYPCVFGIPVMPTLFKTAKFYIYICFCLVGAKVCMTVYDSYDNIYDTPAVSALGVRHGH